MYHDYPVFRTIGRGPSYPDHRVVLYLKGERVGGFSLPAGDPRFVKSDDLFRIAYNRIIHIQSNDGFNRRSTDPKPGSWDEFEVFTWTGPLRGDVKGEVVRERRSYLKVA